MSMGREFHNLGAHEEKALSPYEENVFGILRRSLWTHTTKWLSYTLLYKMASKTSKISRL